MAFLPHRCKNASGHGHGVVPWCFQHQRNQLGRNGGEIAAAGITCGDHMFG
jgi:hypothetical protein